MASPYTIRSKNQVSSPIPHGNLFKTFETTPKLGSRRLFPVQNSKYQKMTAAKSGDQQTPSIRRAKAQVLRKHFSHQQLSNFQQHSYQYNESSIQPERQKRSDQQLQRYSQNPHCKQYDHSYVFDHNSLSKEIDHHTDKNSADDELCKDKKRVRKQKNWSCHGVPYRKCHSSMEEKVVSIINKIKSGKYCNKQIETLIEKSKKISIKELNNKYFVSGIQLISNLAIHKEYKSIFTTQLINRLNEALEDLKNRIISELDNTKGFQMKPNFSEQISFQKIQLVRLAYKVLRRKLKDQKRDQKREQVQDKALKAADWFLDNKVNDLKIFIGQLGQC